MQAKAMRTTAIGLSLALAIGSFCGCHSFGKRGPVEPSVAACRQLSAQGIAAAEHGDYGRARRLCEQAIEACPTNVEARRHLAEALWRQGGASDAILQMEIARRLAPDDSALTVRVGQMYFDAGQIDMAEDRAVEAIDEQPENPQAWALHGAVAFRRGALDEALSDCIRSAGYAPNQPDVALLTVEIYRRKGRPDRALAVLRGLIDTYRRSEEPQLVLARQGDLLVELGRPDDAAVSYRLALSRGEGRVDLYYRLAEAEALAGQSAAASRSVERALAIDQQHPESLALQRQLQIAARSAVGTNLR